MAEYKIITNGVEKTIKVRDPLTKVEKEAFAKRYVPLTELDAETIEKEGLTEHVKLAKLLE